MSDPDLDPTLLTALRADPTDLRALAELAGQAARRGYRSAARTAYEQAVLHHPRAVGVRINLGTLLIGFGALEAARGHFAAALAVEPGLAAAHVGLARVAEALGEDEAARHWAAARAAGGAIAVQPYRGVGPGVPVLVLASVKTGNIETQRLLDDRVFAVTAVYAELWDERLKLPAHRLVVNAIGDADLCADALAVARGIVARSGAPVINPPDRVALTGRVESARRLGALADVVTPATRRAHRHAVAAVAAAIGYPLLVRAPGFHTGAHFSYVADEPALAAAVAALPGEAVLAIEWLDARGADGCARKYRAMAIGGRLYPLHLAVSADWKVHYFTAGMAENAAHRAEEQRFLDDMPGVLGARAMAGLEAIATTLGLDYAGIDFALAPDGRVMVFEANATMAIVPPGPEPVWDYRRGATGRALEAVGGLAAARLNPAA